MLKTSGGHTGRRLQAGQAPRARGPAATATGAGAAARGIGTISAARSPAWWPVLLAGLLLEACQEDNPVAPGDEGAPGVAAVMADDSTKIVVEPHWLTLDTTGVSDTLTATVIDAEGDTIDDAKVTWESADTAIATVDTAGVVTSVDFGRTRVTATYDSATAWATVEVALPLTDREILEILYEATGGDDWTDNTNWLSDEELSQWYGVHTYGDGRVRDLDLYANELTGEIPAEIGGLGRLESLRLNYNGVSGEIPAELGKLTRLGRLELNNNRLEGAVPPEMGGLKNLEYLDVAINKDVGGMVPHTFAGLELETFYSSETGLCTPPSLKGWFDEIENTDNPTLCTARIALDPPSLYFESLGDTATLSATAVGAEGDTLDVTTVTWASGDTAVATVAATGLVTTVGYGTTQITANADSLTGTAAVEIVFTLSDRDILEILYEATAGGNWKDTTNWLSDEPLSEWFGVYTSDEGRVDSLILRSNDLGGSIPSELSELDDLLHLNLSRNEIGGPIPDALGALKQLVYLRLTDNALDGPLPAELGDLTALRHLRIYGNDMEGVVPGSFADLELKTFRAGGSGVCLPPSLDEWFEGIDNTDDLVRCADKLVIASPSVFYAIGETQVLSASFVDAEGDTTHAVAAAWTSADTAIATVDTDGLVTATGDGTTEVTATYDSSSASVEVEVALPEDDRDVLEILYNRVGGDAWTVATNWLSDEPLSEWFGVETDDSGRVVGLSLASNNLRGRIHSSIGQLDRLATLDLDRNWISGSIPVELADLTLLRRVALSVNGLVGELPPELGTLDSLRTLKLSATTVSGRVPASFADLELDTLHTNGTTVCVPPSLSGWLDSIAVTDDPPECAARVVVDPSTLTFRARDDTARLSATVFDAEGIVVDDAQVTWKSADTKVARVDTTGLVTARASGVTTVTATYDSAAADSADVAVRLPGSDRDALEAFYRAMSGDDWADNTNWMSDEPLGAWYGVDTTEDGRVNDLSLPNNNLTGRLPTAIGLLGTLTTLDLKENELTGPIPPAMARLRHLKNLFLRDNEDLSGPPPPEMGNMAGLEFLNLTNTGLSGPLPQTFAKLTLDRFYLEETGLCVPRSLAKWYESIGNDEWPPCIPETADRDALVALYNATGGPNWEGNWNWLKPWSVNTWEGITTDGEGFVTSIFLPENNLAGPIPPELSYYV